MVGLRLEWKTHTRTLPPTPENSYTHDCGSGIEFELNRYNFGSMAVSRKSCGEERED